jgi:large subunit ribosomal protein L32
MAAALLPTRTLLLSIERPSFAKYLLPTFLAGSFNLSIPSLQSILDLFPPFLLAVPKKKTSHSRKAMRSANKGLKDKKSTSSVLDRLGFSLSYHIRHCSLSGLWFTQACASSLRKLLYFPQSPVENASEARGCCARIVTHIMSWYCVVF